MKSCLFGDTRKVTPVLKQLNANPFVVTSIEGLLLPEEADALVRLAEKKGMHYSTTVKNGKLVVDVGRTSRTCPLLKNENSLVTCLEDRLSTFAGHPSSHLEPLQITDYKNKQEYKAHYDFLNSGEGENERTTTVLTYLKDDLCFDGECGGATVFHRVDAPNPLKVYPKKGNAIMW